MCPLKQFLPLLTLLHNLGNCFQQNCTIIANALGTTLRNLESRVESGTGAGAVFPRGHIPHEDVTGPQNNFWAYRWISNKWKYAPWERYPNLM